MSRPRNWSATNDCSMLFATAFVTIIVKPVTSRIGYASHGARTSENMISRNANEYADRHEQLAARQPAADASKRERSTQSADSKTTTASARSRWHRDRAGRAQRQA